MGCFSTFFLFFLFFFGFLVFWFWILGFEDWVWLGFEDSVSALENWTAVFVVFVAGDDEIVFFVGYKRSHERIFGNFLKSGVHVHDRFIPPKLFVHEVDLTHINVDWWDE